MSRISLAMLFLLTLGTLFPQESFSDHNVAVVLDGTKAKSYIVTVDGQGNVTITPLAKTVFAPDVVPDVPDPNPNPNPNPNPPPAPGLSVRAKEIKALAEKVTGDPARDVTAKQLAALYRELGKTVTDGKVKDAPTLALMVKTASDFLLSNNKGNWSTVRTKLSDQWDNVAKQGGRVADYATLLGEAADGLDASSPARAIDPEMLKLILEIVKMVLAMFIKPV